MNNNTRIANMLRFIFMIVIIFLVITGCRYPVKSVPSPVALPEEFLGNVQADTIPLTARWWETFENEQLSALVEQTLAENFQMREAWDRLAQAEALAVQAGAAQWPDATLAGGAGRTWQETKGTYQAANRYSAGIGIGYELDIWGQIRAFRTAAELDVEISCENIYATALVLTGTVARNWCQYVEAQAQIKVLERQIETNRQVLELITTRFGQGKTGAADVLRQQQFVQGTLSGLIVAQERVQLLHHALAVLAGQTPEHFSLPAVTELPPLPPGPALLSPTSLLPQRPDVRSALLAVQAADQRLGAAIAEQYPRISLSADAETSAAKVRDLFDNWLASLAGNLMQPLFDAGLRQAEVQRRRAIVSQALNQYGQTLLQALQEMENALTQEQRQREYLASLTEQFNLAQKVLERTQESYIKGQLDYLRVLDALVSVQSLERNILTAQQELLSRRIDLYQAVGGRQDLARPAPATLP